jgi:transcriptional regulator
LLLDSIDSKRWMLEETIKTYDTAYLDQWSNISEEYKLRMMNGFTAFEIEVNNVIARKKLSQEKPEQAKQNIINQLRNSDDSLSRDTAGYMAAMQNPGHSTTSSL